MQQHRGLSSGVLNGNDAMKDKRAVKEKELADAVMATDTALSGKLRDLLARCRAIRDDWEAIRKDRQDAAGQYQAPHADDRQGAGVHGRYR